MRDSTSTSIAGPFDRRPATLLLMGVGLVVALSLAWMGRAILMLLFASIVVSAVVTALVEWIGGRFNVRRGVSLPLILCVATGLVGLTVWLSGASVIAQFADLQTDLPRAAHELIERLNAYGWGRWLMVQWSGYTQLSGTVSIALTRIGGIVLSTATVVSGLVVIGFPGIYLAAEPEAYFSYVQRVTPIAYRAKLKACAAAAVQNLRWWVLSQMLSMAAVGVIVAVGLWMLGVPLAGLLGMIAALLTFIPNLGPIVSVVPAVLLAVAISPMKGVLTLLLFVGVHLLEGNVITPLLERRIVRLPPALTMTAQLLLAVIAGPLGLALAAPLAAAALGVFNVLVPPEDGGLGETSPRPHSSRETAAR